MAKAAADIRVEPDRVGAAAWQRDSAAFWVRLALAYLIVPFLSFLPLTLSIRESNYTWSRGGGDGLGMTLFYTVFGSLAMLVFGSPLIAVFWRFQITAFWAFSAAGAVCAGLTVALPFRLADRSMIPFFLVVGAIAGYLFRLILFGVKR